jgi:CMP-N,N'-diacetyllegionaminic acid synthase
MSVLAIIPARSGSKGIPGKNKRLFNGIPLIEYSVQSALKAQKLELIVISTDDSDIIESYKNRPRIKVRERPSNISKDKSPVYETIYDVLNKYKDEIKEKTIKLVMLLQPTSPIRTSLDIDKSIDLLQKNKDYNSLVSVCEMEDVHPGRMYWLNKDGSLKNIMPKFENTRRQENPPVYFRNGAIYLTSIKKIHETSMILNEPILPYKMSSDFLLNIDGKRDLIISDSILKAWEKEINIENN